MEIKRFVSELVTVVLSFVEYGDKEDPWTYDSWYQVNATQNCVELTKDFETLEDANAAFDEFCKNGFDTEAELVRRKAAAEAWAQLESEVYSDDDYSIEE